MLNGCLYVNKRCLAFLNRVAMSEMLIGGALAGCPRRLRQTPDRLPRDRSRTCRRRIVPPNWRCHYSWLIRNGGQRSYLQPLLLLFLILRCPFALHRTIHCPHRSDSRCDVTPLTSHLADGVWATYLLQT